MIFWSFLMILLRFLKEMQFSEKNKYFCGRAVSLFSRPENLSTLEYLFAVVISMFD